MSGTTIAALPGSRSLTPESAGIAMELEGLRLLLLRTAEALCAGDAFPVEQICNQLTNSAVNLRPAFGELFPNHNGLSLVESEQQRRRFLLPLLEARAFYLAAQRRWRRNLRLRRSLMEMQSDAPAYDEAAISRWY